MRKILNVLLVILVSLTFVGCQKEQEEKKIARIATLSKEEIDAGVAIFLDEDGNRLFEKQIDYPYMLHYDRDAYYYSSDGSTYKSIKYSDFSSGDVLRNVTGTILALNGNSYFTYTTGGVCLIDSSGNEVCQTNYISLTYKTDKYFYYIDSSLYLYICSLGDFSVLNKIQLNSSEFLAICEIDGNVYIADNYGLTLVDDLSLGNTYIYPNDFTEINNIIRNMLFVEENGETVVYQISFDRHKMNLDLVVNEEYYRNINFEEEFSDYYNDGYIIVDYYEMRY